MRNAVAVALLPALVLAGCATEGGEAPEAEGGPTTGPVVDVSGDLGALEERFDARVGVVAVDLQDGRRVEHRGDERFGYASTVKVFVAAALLDATDEVRRGERVEWSQADIDAAGYSPLTQESLDEGLTLDELAEAAVRESDNTATNLVLERLGGPAGLENALRSAGDEETSVDAVEPGINDVTPGEPANTTTPAAFAALLESIAKGDWLESADRERLFDWMSGNATGDPLIRAGAPEGWIVLDKSGGAGPRRGDVALVHPPGREPIVLVVLTERNDLSADYDDALVAEAAALVLGALD
ncbi:class A beta-lactamase [Aeromicrobium halocynthiae]|uniref:Beta-lactamase n=2 Tax=Aeromicrobium halocynthiae TaxID=560557 RepID=A0ABN2VWE4_9ACTN